MGTMVWVTYSTTQIRGIQLGTFIRDADVGGMLHNFMSEEHLQAYMGVDLSRFKFAPLEFKGLISLLSS